MLRAREAALALLVLTAQAARAAAPPPAKAPAPAVQRAPPPAFDLGDGIRGGVRQGRVQAWTVARAGEGWQSLSRRAIADASRWRELASGAGATLHAGDEVVLPRALWRPMLGASLLLRLFPKDRAEPDGGWRHVVTDGATLGFAESTWSLGALFAGDGKLGARLGMSDAARTRGLRPGDVVTVPGGMLLPCWRAAAAEPKVASRSATRAASPPAAKGAAPAGPGVVAQSVPADAAAASKPSASGSADGASPTLSLPATPKGETHAVLRGSGRDLAVDVAGAEGARSEGGDGDDDDGDEPEPVAPMKPCPAPTAAPATSPRDEADLAPADVGAAPPPGSAASRAAEPAPARDDFAVVPGTKSDDGLLTYALDAQGPHAVYRLQRGETLYTHVVLRFTGLLSGKDVNDAARRFAARSRIADVTHIAVGTAVRIPLADLVPVYLPPGHPRRIAWQHEQAETARLARREKRQGLDGVHVVLDAGHGGMDPGAGTDRVWEDDYVYDLACRVRAVLLERTRAVVHPLVKDDSSAFAPLSRIKHDTDEALLSTPPFRLAQQPSRSAVNLRWVLSNDVRRRLVGGSVPEDRIVFVSMHADSLHESARGAMVYYSSAQYRSPCSGLPADGAWRGLKEAVDDNGFTMTPRDMLKSEGLSRALGESIVAAVSRAGLPVHGFSPVRGSIVRSGVWVPAVLKYNRVQAAVLVEACNLNNPEDQLNLRDPAFRQQFAEGIVDGLEAYFGAAEPKAAGGADAAHGRTASR